MSFDHANTGRTFAEEQVATDAHEAADSKQQYTIKGIETETLELMRTAARKQGMKVGAWVSARLREAANKALANSEVSSDELAELREHIRRIEQNQLEERESLRCIQDELSGMLRAQNSIMSKILSTA
jgi:membrane carboxypeptidase/penicillin-binding protein